MSTVFHRHNRVDWRSAETCPWCADVVRLRAYAGSQLLRSDFRTADELRAAYDQACAEVARLRAAIQA